MLPGEPDLAEFAAQMDIVRDAFNVIDLGDAAGLLRRGGLPERAACITFDDGYANNLTVAAPVLKARGLVATVFVSTGYLGGGRMWNDTIIETLRGARQVLDLSSIGLGRYEVVDWEARRFAVSELLDKLKYLPLDQRVATADRVAEAAGVSLPDDLMMSESQVASLSREGIAVGAHTVSHPILKSIGSDAARSEILGSKRRLEEITGAAVRTFAYPNGRPGRDYSDEDVALVRSAGFEAAVSTVWGAARAGADIHQIPRIAPWQPSHARSVMRILKTYGERN